MIHKKVCILESGWGSQSPASPAGFGHSPHHWGNLSSYKHLEEHVLPLDTPLGPLILPALHMGAGH